MAGAFDLDAFLADCLAARADGDGRAAVREVLSRAVATPGAVADVLPADRAGLWPLHVSPDLTVLHVVWGPKMSFKPHDHRMWAAIGIYSGGEDNEFFRRAPEHGLLASGGKSLRPGDAVVLGGETIHAVTNPTDRFAGAIHVYGGDLPGTARSEWDTTTGDERPYDQAATTAYFEAQNAPS